MTTQTRNRLLTIIFLLLVTLLVSELSYYFFNRQSSSQPTPSFQPTPIVASPTPTPNLNLTSSTTTTINQNTIDELIKLIPTPYTYISELTLKFTLQGTLVKRSINSITLQKNQVSEPLNIKFSQQTLNKLQVITTSNSPTNNLNSLQLNKPITVNIVIKSAHPYQIQSVYINQQ